MEATIFVIIYIICLFMYFKLLRKCTIEDNGWGLNSEVAGFAFFMGFIPGLNVILCIMMYGELVGNKRRWWETVLFIKRKE